MNGLSQARTFRLVGSEKIWESGAALSPHLRSSETGLLAEGLLMRRPLEAMQGKLAALRFPTG
jgi:hypothetical protein